MRKLMLLVATLLLAATCCFAANTAEWVGTLEDTGFKTTFGVQDYDLDGHRFVGLTIVESDYKGKDYPKVMFVDLDSDVPKSNFKIFTDFWAKAEALPKPEDNVEIGRYFDSTDKSEIAISVDYKGRIELMMFSQDANGKTVINSFWVTQEQRADVDRFFKTATEFVGR